MKKRGKPRHTIAHKKTRCAWTRPWLYVRVIVKQHPTKIIDL